MLFAQFNALALLGVIGIGLVWGWLMGMWSATVLQLARTISAIAVFTALMSAVVLYFTNLVLVIAFLSSAVIAFLIHLAWRRWLVKRSRSQPV